MPTSGFSLGHLYTLGWVIFNDSTTVVGHIVIRSTQTLAQYRLWTIWNRDITPSIVLEDVISFRHLVETVRLWYGALGRVILLWMLTRVNQARVKTVRLCVTIHTNLSKVAWLQDVALVPKPVSHIALCQLCGQLKSLGKPVIYTNVLSRWSSLSRAVVCCLVWGLLVWLGIEETACRHV